MPENDTKYQERLSKLRNIIEKSGLDGFIVPHTDEFQGEFIADYAQRLPWLTGFTGSAGVAIVLKDRAAVFSDSRYTIQMKNQVNADLYSTHNVVETLPTAWLLEGGYEGLRIGLDAALHTSAGLDRMRKGVEETGIEFVTLDDNLIDQIWDDQPPRPVGSVTLFPDEVAGKSSAQKRQDIANQLIEEGCKACFLTAGDSICWLLNVRGSDIDYSPLIHSYAVLHRDCSVDWFVDEQKLSAKVMDVLGDEVRIYDIDLIDDMVGKINGPVALDRKSTPLKFEELFLKHGIEIKDVIDPCAFPKSIKTESEQASIREAHIYDGVALVKFLKWLDDNQNIESISELSVEEKLASFRAEHPDYLGASFSTIAGFAGNGAIVHYRATTETSLEIKGDGLLLLDSGGQYRWGTTDITRTMAIGTPTREMQENYTRVLKGHIAVAHAEFPRGTKGQKIDALAREDLKSVDLDYAHGTGHGVGCYLCVHEAAANLSPKEERVLEAGMLLSNEPGYYKEGGYGIRLENLILVVSTEESDMLSFETVTFVPFDPKLIVFEMLSEDERQWLVSYHNAVQEKLSQHLDQTHQDWLNQQSQAFVQS